MPLTIRRAASVLALATLAAAAACARRAAGPFADAFQVIGQAPRLVDSGQEATVPLVLVNTGTRPWDPARDHLSYHWLWLVPRELAHRSRTLPFDEGIRTDFAGMVVPGARVEVAARLVAPDRTGVYWLQWDMVEEGVTWFAQVSPRQPRRLTIVVPFAALTTIAAGVPLLVALLGMFWAAKRRRGRGAVGAWAAAWWAASVLLIKPLISYRLIQVEPSATAYILTVAIAALIGALCVLLPRRAGVVLALMAGTVATFVVAADILYYRFFGDVLSAPAVFAAQQTGAVWQSIRSLMSRDVVVLLADLPVAWVLGVFALLTRNGAISPPRRRAPVGSLAVAASLVLLAGVPHARRAGHLDQMFRNRDGVEQLGVLGFHAYDGWTFLATALRPPASQADVDRDAAWFAARAPYRAGTGPLFGAARGRNLIVVQIESLQDFAVDAEIDGQPVMPHLRAWGGDALRFTNVTDQTSEGRTSDAEFTTMVSLLPTDHGAVAFRYAANHYVALPRVLADRGYSTLSAVAFDGAFWNRRIMHPKYGFQRSFFGPDFRMTEQIGWGLNDKDFLQQMVPRLEAQRRPFCAWLITLSLHHPFDGFPDAHKELRLGALDGTPFGNYLHAMHFADAALDAFRGALSADGLLDDSVLVVFGDHDAGFPQTADVVRAMGIAPGLPAWTSADRIPLFMRVPVHGHSQATSGERTTPAGQTDVAPTILALLGIDPAPFPFIGRNLLGTPGDTPVLRPYGDWVDTQYLFFRQRGPSREPSCYDLRVRADVDAARCAGADMTAEAARTVSRQVVADDLQDELRAFLSAGS